MFLLDPGAALNFISKKLVDVLKIPVFAAMGFGVQLGNGDQIPTEGVCRGVCLHLQGVEIIEDFILLSLGSTDVILGIQWLETLRVTLVNWKTQLLKFRFGSSTVSIKGESYLGQDLDIPKGYVANRLGTKGMGSMWS